MSKQCCGPHCVHHAPHVSQQKRSQDLTLSPSDTAMSRALQTSMAPYKTKAIPRTTMMPLLHWGFNQSQTPMLPITRFFMVCQITNYRSVCSVSICLSTRWNQRSGSITPFQWETFRVWPLCAGQMQNWHLGDSIFKSFSSGHLASATWAAASAPTWKLRLRSRDSICSQPAWVNQPIATWSSNLQYTLMCL